MKLRFTPKVLCVLFLMMSTLANAQIPELLYYKFDTPGISVTNDALTPVGTSPATITGTGLSIGSTGLSGTALVGTGASSSSNYINTGWATNLTGSFTIAFWTSNISTVSTLWYIWGDPSASSLRCFTNGAAGTNNWMVRGGGLPDLTLTGGATTGSNMNHAVYDATTNQFRGYVNGILVNTVTVSGTIAMSGTGFHIGGYSSNAGLNGNMDEFRIYNRALTQAEITATYNQTLGAMSDIFVQAFAGINDSVCSGNQTVSVWVKNNGPHAISNAKFDWSVNATAQPTYSWTGSLPAGDSSIIDIGNYNFLVGNLYNIEAYATEVNNGPDTLNNLNDTVFKNGIYIKTTPIATPNDTSIIGCMGDSILISGTLTGSPPWNMTLTDGTNTLQINNINTPTFSLYVHPATSTTYTIIAVEDANGCINQQPCDILVGLQPAPPANISPSGPVAICSGNSTMLTGSIGLNFNYEWFLDGVAIPDTDTFELEVFQAGNYTVKVTSGAGCSNISAPVTVFVHPSPTVFLGNDTNIAPGANISLDAGPGFNSYMWSTGATTQMITVDSAGHGLGILTVWVIVQDNNYCEGKDTININFVLNPGLDELFPDEAISLYPNPTAGEVTVTFRHPMSNNIKISIYSSDGRLLTEKQYNHCNTNKTLQLDLEQFTNGIYLIKAESGSSTVTRKLILQR